MLLNSAGILPEGREGEAETVPDEVPMEAWINGIFPEALKKAKRHLHFDRCLSGRGGPFSQISVSA